MAKLPKPQEDRQGWMLRFAGEISKHWRQEILLRQSLCALLIAVSTAWIYFPALHGGWIWDDELLISQNPLIKNPSGLWNIWFHPGGLVDYQPIEVSVVWLEWHLWGNNTPGYHTISTLLHIANSLLVWRLLSKLGLRLAWVGGLLFAIHPVMVESVAWVSELKNTISLPPFLLAMCAYIDYYEHKKARDYFLSFGLFLLALLCKPTMVMFPLIILLYAWWKRRHISFADLKASAPFFFASIIVGLVTIWFLKHTTYALGGREEDIPMGGFYWKLACAGSTLSFYLSKSISPLGLMPIYPKWSVDPFSPMAYLPWLALGGITLICWFRRASWGSPILLGLGFFLINLAPFLGFYAAPYMEFTWVMDHLLYLPIIGLIGVAVAALEIIKDRCATSVRVAAFAVTALSFILMARESHGYSSHYRDAQDFWTYTAQRNPTTWLAPYNLGIALMTDGKTAEAASSFQEGIKLNPEFANAYYYRGLALARMERMDEAITEFREALHLNASLSLVEYNLGVALLKTGHPEEALERCKHVLKEVPQSAAAHYTAGVALTALDRIPEAMDQFKATLTVDPDYTEAHLRLRELLLQTGHPAEATEQDEAALRKDSHHNEYLHNTEDMGDPEKHAPTKN